MKSLQERLASSVEDRYEVGRELGRGGMATVFLARDLRHDREVAIKVLHPELTHTLGADRFLREIQIAARLHHPHILPVYDSGHTDGLLYYVMPFVEGPSLRQRLEREVHLPVDEALRITRQIASALSYAERHGVIHRDIKPENILIQDGYALLADFGVARALDEASGGKLTQVGVAIGTPLYMSPEQFAARATVDVRSDLYSLACVLYEMLAGTPPFTGPTTQAITARHTADPLPPLRTLRPAVPAEVEATIGRAMAKVPADRFPDVESFLLMLPPSGTTTPLQTVVATTPETHGASFFSELKRRKVYRALVLYIAFALAALQGAQAIQPALNVPDWLYQYIVLALILGLPVTAVVAWAYDLTKSGFRRNTPGVGTRIRDHTTREAYGRAGVLAVLGVVGLALGFTLDITVLREREIPIDIDRIEARRIGERFLGAQGASGSFKSDIALHTIDSIALFRERAKQTDAVRAENAGPLWHWHLVWFRYGEESRWSVEVGAGGRIVGFRHFLPDTAAGSSVAQQEAQPIAAAFLRNMDWRPETLSLVESGSSIRNGRSDHSFAWVDSAKAVPWSGAEGADLALPYVAVGLAGTEVVRYQHHIRLASDFEDERRSVEYVQNWVLSLGLILMIGLGIFQVSRNHRDGKLDWPLGFRFGALAGALLALALGTGVLLEGVDSSRAPARSWIAQVAPNAFGMVVLAFLVAGLAWILFTATDALVRSSFPGRMDAAVQLLRGQPRSAAVAASMIAGTAMGLLLYGLSASLTAVVEYIPGVWRGAVWPDVAGDMPIASLLPTAFAMVFIMAVGQGFVTAVVQRSTRSTAMAVLIPTLVLAFMSRSHYPVYVGQLVIGATVLMTVLIFLRFGLLASMTALWVWLLADGGIGYLDAGASGLLAGSVILAFAFLPLLFVVLTRPAGADVSPPSQPIERAPALRT